MRLSHDNSELLIPIPGRRRISRSGYRAIWLKTCKIQEAVTSQGESIRPQLAVFLHDKHPRTLDPLGKPREMMEPDSLGG